MEKNEEKLLICTRFIGRLSENSTTKYKLDNNKIINCLETKGIMVIRAKNFSAETNAGIRLGVRKFYRKTNFSTRK